MSAEVEHVRMRWHLLCGTHISHPGLSFDPLLDAFSQASAFSRPFLEKEYMSQ
jgi:hypothetical protein